MKTKQEKDQNQPLFPISVAAQILGVHPQTLRLYEREGLVTPSRTKGKTRLYSEKDIEQLKTVLYFTQDMGINLAGVGLFLEMQRKINEMDREMKRIVEHFRTMWEGEGCFQADSPSPDSASTKKIVKIRIEQG